MVAAVAAVAAEGQRGRPAMRAGVARRLMAVAGLAADMPEVNGGATAGQDPRVATADLRPLVPRLV